MFCEKCGSPIPGASPYCPTCGAQIVQQAAPVNQRTKSKWLAFILMWFGFGDIYLGNWKRFWTKLGIAIPTLGIGYIVMVFSDMIGILTGRLNSDVNGIPLV